MNWTPLTELSQLDHIVTESAQQPVLIFKHSTRCSISSTSLNRLERNWDNSKAGNMKPYYLDLLNFRPISNEIAQRFGVEHESPQVLLIKNGDCVYFESQFGISFDAILKN